MCSSFTRRFACGCDVVVNLSCLSSLDGDDEPCTKTDTIVIHPWVCRLCGKSKNPARYPSVVSDGGEAEFEDGSNSSSYLEGVPSDRPTVLLSTFDWLAYDASTFDQTSTPCHIVPSLISPPGTVDSSWSDGFERDLINAAWIDLHEAMDQDHFEGEQTARSSSSPRDVREGESSKTKDITDLIISKYASYYEGDGFTDEGFNSDIDIINEYGSCHEGGSVTDKDFDSDIDIIEAAPPGSDSESDVDIIEVAPPKSDSDSDVDIIEVAPPESDSESDPFNIEIYPPGQEPDFNSPSPSSPSEVEFLFSRAMILLGAFIWFNSSFCFAFWYLLVRSQPRSLLNSTGMLPFCSL